MKQITRIRKAVCAMANELKKSGYSLSESFRRAWKWGKQSMTIRVAGTTYENRQERLEFLKQFQPQDLTVTLEREPDNQYDSNIIQIVVHIRFLAKKIVIGYVPKRLSGELAKVLDMGISVKVSLIQIIGGYSYKKMLGALINIAIQKSESDCNQKRRERKKFNLGGYFV